MRRFAAVLIVVAMVLGGCYNRHDEPSAPEFTTQASCKIAQLRELCSEGCTVVTEERVCVGRITSSDLEGNFYRSIIVEDESGGVEVKVGGYNLATPYPVGLMVALHLNGSALMIENGVVQMGLPPQSYDSSPRELALQAVIDQHIVRSNSVVGLTPHLCDIPSLEEALCGRFVRIEGLHYAPLTNEEEVERGEYLRFVDSNENAIFLYISSYAEFAEMEIPTSEVTIQGILYHQPVGMDIGRQFVIKPRFKDDITITDSNS